jgi:hypothetical protein
MSPAGHTANGSSEIGVRETMPFDHGTAGADGRHTTRE